ncbi:HD domain-containing protein [Actinomycetaceae bacterium L2_0104]
MDSQEQLAILHLRESRRSIAPTGKDSRARWTTQTERALVELWDRSLAEQGAPVEPRGLALAAVGSLGRRDCGPESDIDLVLFHDGKPHRELKDGLQGLADSLWYPIWDSHIELDHSVRSLAECRGIAKADLAASLGLLDIRRIAGDRELVEDATSRILADWRAGARQRFSELTDRQAARRRQFGRLAYLIEGDIKEAAGGLRDALLIKAMVASWLAERPAIAYEPAYEFLLDVRDGLASLTRRHNHVLRLEYQDDVAALLGFTGQSGQDPADELLMEIAQAARTIRAAYAETARRAQGNLRAPERPRFKPRMVRGRAAPPVLQEIVPGVAESGGELVLSRSGNPADPRLLLAMARAAAERDLPIRLATLQHLEQAGAGRELAYRWELGEPWPQWAREDFEAILGSSRGQITVWEFLDIAGLLTQLVPAWEEVRNLPQRSAIHRHTVDRHQIEVVSRIPDVTSGQVALADLSPRRRSALLLAALFHDIGKRPGHPRHAQRGAEMIPGILTPMGYPRAVVDVVVVLTRHHLLLGDLATSADPEEPQTWRSISAAVQGDAELLACLHLLTQADASSCKPEAWDEWKASLVANLVRNTRASLA